MRVYLVQEITLQEMGHIGPGEVDLPDVLAAGLIAQRIAREVVEMRRAPKTAAMAGAPARKGGA